jgi:ATP/maltotriose-dependent transcriptional regulator MalT/DNA-binding SARP family transcriptional activator
MDKQQGAQQAQSVAPGSGPGTDTQPVIMTKIRVPRRRGDLLPRRRLVDFFHAQLERKLIIVSAPAGYGKTSLLTDFAHDTDLPVCWYTLDSFDRDMRVFLEHLIAAIALRFPAFGHRSRTFLRETPDPGANLYPLVATLVQEIYDKIPEYFVLVLDDHHNVEDQEQIQEFLDLFVTYVDENCHLLISSRTLPALPSLSLLVARRQAAGLSIDELRFTPHEVQALARQNYRLQLTQEQASTLAERTGGWITGLLLTTAHRWEQTGTGERPPGDVAVRGRINVDVYDYLTRQVLERQPAPLQDFLLASSVLDELSPELCDAVLETDGTEAFMDQLRNRNLFITEFEGEQNQLRYHDLFREFLQDALHQQNNVRFCELMRRAAQVYAARGEWERAVSRYLFLAEYEPAVEIVRKTAAHLFDLGRWDTLAGWIDALPEPVRAAQPSLLIHRAKIHSDRGEYERALALCTQAERAMVAANDRAGQAYAVAMKGYVLRIQGHYAEGIAHSEEALNLVPGSSVEERAAMALAQKNIGLCRFRQAKLAQGQAALEEALHLYEGLNASYDVGMVQHDLGLGHELMWDLDGAIRHYDAALLCWQQLGSPGPWANTLNGLGVVYSLQGRYEEASRTLDEALNKAQKAGDSRVEAFIWASLGDLYHDLGAYERAQQSFAQAAEIAERSRVGFILTYATNGLGNLSRLQSDPIGAGKQLRKALDLAREHGSDYERSLCYTSLGILAAERNDLTTARQQLDQAVQVFEAGGFQRDLALACLHRAQVAFQAGDGERALIDLSRALALVEQLGFDQFLVVEGQRLSRLLGYAEEQGVRPDVLPGLLARIEAHRVRVAARPEPTVRQEPQQSLTILGLGAPEVRLGGKTIQWETSQSRDVLFCLLQHAQGLRKEEMGALFWPDHPPRRLDGIFRSTLYRLRRAAFREIVLFEDGLYRFNWQCDRWFDVEAFEKLLDQAEATNALGQASEFLEEALSLYRGEYLQGVYADWCSIERERLRERYLTALEALARMHANRGSLQRAIEEYQRLVARDPYRESAHRELMRCHYRLGDRFAAIKQYQFCAQILREDLGLSPAPETEELYLTIIG